MIDITDAGVRMAIERAVGHPAPFSADELAALTELRVHSAAEISELRHCPGLSVLELVACDVRTLATVPALDRLSRLHVLGCPIEGADPLAGHPVLEDLRLDFCFLQDLEPLTTIGTLRRGRFIGNPLDPASWDDVRPRWQQTRVARTNRARLLEFGPRHAWEITRLMWNHQVRLCFALMDGVRPALVRPGISQSDGALVDACHANAAGLIIATERGDTADEIFRRNSEFADSRGLARPADFSSHRAFGDAEDARSWIEPAADRDRPFLDRFIGHFPDQIFFREDAVILSAIGESAGTPVPAPIVGARSVLAGVLPDEDARFRLTGYIGTSPRVDSVPTIWYNQSLGSYSTPDRRRLFLGEAGLSPLAEWIETADSILAVRATGDDPAIYEFSEEDLDDARSEGRPFTDSVYRVFSSYAEMLAHIAGFILPDGRLITASDAGPERPGRGESSPTLE
jgi:hypothetical protein